MCTDHLGRPLRFLLTGWQRNDCTQGIALIEGFSPSHVLADKGYDTDELVSVIRNMDAEAVIPPRKNRKNQRAFDLPSIKRETSSREPLENSSNTADWQPDMTEKPTTSWLSCIWHQSRHGLELNVDSA